MFDNFINALAGFYRNRLLGDTFLNRLEQLPGFPRTLSRKLRGVRDHEFFFERPYRLAHRYRRILGNQGAVYVTTDISDFHRRLALSIREYPKKPKGIHGGDGARMQALTTGINYVDSHNDLEEKVARSLEAMISERGGAQIEESLQHFLTGLNLSDANHSRSDFSPTARLALSEKRVDFIDIEPHLTLNEDEKKFVEYYRLTLADLLKGKVPYPTFGFGRGGTFDVLPHHLHLDKGTKYIETLMQQMEENFLMCSRFRPLKVEYTDEQGDERTLYGGTVYGHGAIRAFFDLYYAGELHPGPLKAMYVSLLYRYFHRKKYEKLTAPYNCNYEIKYNGGRIERFCVDTTLSIATGISRLPFKMQYFQPDTDCMHFAATGKHPNVLVKKGLLSIPGLGGILLLFRVKDAEVEHSYRNVSSVTIRSSSVRFMLDGDIKDHKDVQYNSPEVKLSLGPQLMIANPSRGDVRVEV